MCYTTRTLKQQHNGSDTMQAQAQLQQELISAALHALKEYVDFMHYDSTHADSCVEDVAQHVDDVVYVCKIVKQFAQDKDVAKFCDALYAQDTLVRDYFADVIYIAEEFV